MLMGMEKSMIVALDGGKCPDPMSHLRFNCSCSIALRPSLPAISTCSTALVIGDALDAATALRPSQTAAVQAAADSAPIHFGNVLGGVLPCCRQSICRVSLSPFCSCSGRSGRRAALQPAENVGLHRPAARALPQR